MRIYGQSLPIETSNMTDYVFLIALLTAVILLGAWREYADDNRRDAKLLAAFGAGGTLASAAVWLA